VPGCPQLTDSRYCLDHQQQYGKAEAWKHTVQSSAARGYGAPWRKKRARILQREGYLCQVCRLRDATDVDHIVPKFKGGTDEDRNLQAICDGCHKVKTLKEREEARKQRNSTPQGRVKIARRRLP
jgi:5-methylcytosine-specific restriction protein A